MPIDFTEEVSLLVDQVSELPFSYQRGIARILTQKILKQLSPTDRNDFLKSLEANFQGQAEEEIDPDDQVDEASRESFPASDPPAFSQG